MSTTKDKIIEAVASMSVMNIIELIAAMEEKFGVSASSITTGDSASSNGSSETNSDANIVEEKTEFDVVLQSVGANKIAVIKAVRSVTGLGLKEAKDLVESAPATLKENLNKDDAEFLKKSLEETGAKVELK